MRLPLALRLLPLVVCAALLSARPALAQGELPEPWPGDTPMVDVWNEYWDFIFTMPEGGRFLSQEEVGIAPGDDPMEYAVIWGNDGTVPTLIETLQVGCFDNGADITPERFDEIFAEENANVGADFPQPQTDPFEVDLGNSTWSMVTMRSPDGATELAKLSTFSGAVYYTVFFSYPATVDGNLGWSQIKAIAETFGNLSLDPDYQEGLLSGSPATAPGTETAPPPADDEYYDEDEYW